MSETKTETKDLTAEEKADYEKKILEAIGLNLGCNIENGRVAAPYGYEIEVQIGKARREANVICLQVIYLVNKADFDEPLIDPVDAEGVTEKDVIKMALDVFWGGLWHPLNQAGQQKDPIAITGDCLGTKYEFDMYSQSVVRVGVTGKQPTSLAELLKDVLPKYLGSKKYYWLRIFLVKYNENKRIEVRINGSVCTELSEYFEQYVDTEMDGNGKFVSEKQFAIFVQKKEDECPFDKKLVTDAAKKTIQMMEQIASADGYKKMAARLEELTGGNKCLAAEIRIFVPEILAKLVLQYKEGDSLFMITGTGEDAKKLEFKKTQLRSYFYLQQVVLEYLSTNPDEMKVMRIVQNSTAFRELANVIRKQKERGNEIKPSDLFVPGTAYAIMEEGYRVW